MHSNKTKSSQALFFHRMIAGVQQFYLLVVMIFIWMTCTSSMSTRMTSNYCNVIEYTPASMSASTRTSMLHTIARPASDRSSNISNVDNSSKRVTNIPVPVHVYADVHVPRIIVGGGIHGVHI